MGQPISVNEKTMRELEALQAKTSKKEETGKEIFDQLRTLSGAALLRARQELTSDQKQKIREYNEECNAAYARLQAASEAVLKCGFFTRENVFQERSRELSAARAAVNALTGVFDTPTAKGTPKNDRYWEGAVAGAIAGYFLR